MIVLNWNCAEDSIACAKSLLSQEGKAPVVLFVDNASSDDSVKKLEKFCQNHKSTFLLKNASNIGFAGGVNTGIRYLLDKKYTYIGFLNPDAIADKRWATELVSQLEHYPEAGIATGLLLSRDGSHIDSSGELYSLWGSASPRNRGDKVSEAPAKPGFVFGATGGSVVYRSSLFKKIGLFDEKFFMYYEDVDLSFRAQLARLKVRYTPSAIAYHAQGSSANKVSGLAAYNTFKNLPMLFWKNVPFKLFPKIAPRFFLAYHLILGNAIYRGKGIPAIKGWVVSLILLPRSLSLRRKVQNSKKVSTDYINSIILNDIPPDQTGLRKFRKFFTGKA